MQFHRSPKPRETERIPSPFRRISATFTRRIWLFVKLSIVKLLLVLFDIVAWLFGKLVRRMRTPVAHGVMRLKQLVLRVLAILYFIVLRVRKRFSMLFIQRGAALVRMINVFAYRIVIFGIVFATIAFNIFGHHIDAEELRYRIPLNDVIGTNDETGQYVTESALSIQEGSTVTNEGVLEEELIALPYVPDSDDDDHFASDIDETIIAPSIVDGTGVAPSREGIEIYAVQTGDTIGAIAQRFDLNVNTILWANNLSWTSMIKPGQQLTILPMNGLTHTVKAGETVAQIAKKYQANTDEVVTQNKLANAAAIKKGDVILIPNGIKPSAVRTVQQPRSLPQAIKDIFDPSTAPAAVDTGTRLVWPLISQRITQRFSYRHTGLDVGDKVGKPIYAAEDGRVTRAGWNRGYGYNIVVDHGNGITTLYGHASKLLFKAGDVVSRGQIIALIGNTGWSTGPHLHFEVRVNGKRANPLNYLR